MRDDNAVPSEVVLLPITDNLPYFDDEAKQNVSLRKADRDTWWEESARMADILRRRAIIARNTNDIKKEDTEKYFQSGNFL